MAQAESHRQQAHDTEVLGQLPWHHRDPFHRLLIAQATLEDVVLISSDKNLRPYGIQIAW